MTAAVSSVVPDRGASGCSAQRLQHEDVDVHHRGDSGEDAGGDRQATRHSAAQTLGFGNWTHEPATELPDPPPPPSLSTSRCRSASTRGTNRRSRPSTSLRQRVPRPECLIVGTELKQVERVTGRLTRQGGRRRVLSGVWIGLFIGLVVSLFSEGSSGVIILSTMVFGADHRPGLGPGRVRRHPRTPRLHLGRPGRRHALRSARRAPVRRAGPSAPRRHDRPRTRTQPGRPQIGGRTSLPS